MAGSTWYVLTTQVHELGLYDPIETWLTTVGSLLETVIDSVGSLVGGLVGPPLGLHGRLPGPPGLVLAADCLRVSEGGLQVNQRHFALRTRGRQSVVFEDSRMYWADFRGPVESRFFDRTVRPDIYRGLRVRLYMLLRAHIYSVSSLFWSSSFVPSQISACLPSLWNMRICPNFVCYLCW